MAVVQYSNVYRSGAASGSPVTSIYVCDSYTELPAGIYGDIAFTKDIGVVYVNRGAWTPIVLQTTGNFPLTGDVVINKSIPALILDDTGIVGNVRLSAPYGNAFLSTNAHFNGGPWTTDDPTQNGTILNLEYSNLRFFTVPAGGSETLRFMVDFNGGVYERGRNYPLGTPFSFEVSSANFWTDGWSLTVNLSITKYTYWVLGGMMYISLYLGMTVNSSGMYLNFHTPNGIYIQGIGRYWGSMGTSFLGPTGPAPVRCYATEGSNAVTCHLMNNQPWPVGNHDLMLQLSFPVG